MSVLSKRIRDLRRAKGWEPGELASCAGISRTALDRIEQGQISNPQATTLRQICEALGVAPELLMAAAPVPAADTAPEFVGSDISADVLAPNGSPQPAPSPQMNPVESSLPATTFDESNFPAVNSEAWGIMNCRRAELITEKNREGLTDAEQVEYDRLQELSHNALEKAFPRPKSSMDDLTRLREQLRAESERR